jgi:subtilisin family serine protease
MNARLATLLAAAAIASASAARVDPAVHRALRKQGTADIFVRMHGSTTESLESLQESEFTSREAKISSMVKGLEAMTAEAQRPLENLLTEESAEVQPRFASYKKYWITNQVFIEAASPALLEKLLQMSEVAEVYEQEIIQIEEPVFEQVDNNTVSAVEWGVERVQATGVWAEGNKGENIVVGIIDTGVRGTHEAVKDNYRGAYGWYDPENKADAPYDNLGHGTHCIGTIAGANGVGVAPAATWMACKACRFGGCPQSDLLECAQFMTCPTDTNGENKDCSKAPHLVSNSWGGSGGRDIYRDAVNAWLKAGIIPIFANGNSGPSCTTASSPGDYETVIAVGATDINDGLASFSSKGPSKSGLLKPDLSGPGVNIRSSWNTGDAEYKAISGTSMATPHVSGCIALLLSAKPDLTFEEVRDILTKSVDTASLQPSNQVCGGTGDDTFPNNQYGYGRVNVLSAIQKLA